MIKNRLVKNPWVIPYFKVITGRQNVAQWPLLCRPVILILANWATYYSIQGFILFSLDLKNMLFRDMFKDTTIK